MDVSRSRERYWLLLASVIVVVILAAGVHWSLAHPFGTSWDEAGYLNEAQTDTQRLQHGMLLKLGNRILIKSFGRPPAYRVLSLPIAGLIGFSATKVRLVSLTCFALSSLFVYRASHKVAGRAASIFSVLIFCLSPIVVGASIWFSTEGPLYLATAAMLYYLIRHLAGSEEKRRDWIGLGLALGLGFLSKTSFLMIGPPAVALCLVAENRMRRASGIAFFLKAATLAVLVAGPWWLLNAKLAVAYASYARGFVAGSLGPHSFASRITWINSVIQCLLGPGTSIVIGLVLISFLALMLVGKKERITSLQKWALVTCVCAGLPIVVTQLVGTNDLLRHISPAVIPFAIFVAVLAGQTVWTRNAAGIAVSWALFCAQLLMLLYPVAFPNTKEVDSSFINGALPWQVMTLKDQWDWSPLLTISNHCGVPSPKIAYLGIGETMNDAQLERPWVTAAAQKSNVVSAFPDIHLLWRDEEGPIDWQKVTRSAEQSDIVVTAPALFNGGNDMDDLSNQHNAELAERLSSDPQFRNPIALTAGRFKPIEISVFVNNSLSCAQPDVSALQPRRLEEVR